MQYVWLIWTLVLLLAWIIGYAFLKSRQSRREMLVVSIWTSVLGLTEPFFVPAYWNPPSLFNLAQRTGFDIESILWAFALGGLAAILYEWLFPSRHIQIAYHERIKKRHRYHAIILFLAPIIFFALLATTELNPIYDAIIGLMGGGFGTWYCRPDLKRRMIISAFSFAAFYFLYFQLLLWWYPGYVAQVWNLGVLLGILIAGIPLEELLFAFGVGFLWSSVYAHFTWRTTNNH